MTVRVSNGKICHRNADTSQPPTQSETTESGTHCSKFSGNRCSPAQLCWITNDGRDFVFNLWVKHLHSIAFRGNRAGSYPQ